MSEFAAVAPPDSLPTSECVDDAPVGASGVGTKWGGTSCPREEGFAAPRKGKARRAESPVPLRRRPPRASQAAERGDMAAALELPLSSFAERGVLCTEFAGKEEVVLGRVGDRAPAPCVSALREARPTGSTLSAGRAGGTPFDPFISLDSSTMLITFPVLESLAFALLCTAAAFAGPVCFTLRSNAAPSSLVGTPSADVCAS